MKTKTIFLSFLAVLTAGFLRAQDRTTVTATSSDISDNLDLRAVASLFGDSANLEDFERRLNDPKTQISNLDLNGDGNVDYLRVIETTEENTHLVVVQAVLEKDVFQDVATIEVQQDGSNVQVQVVGDTYMYGPNYIYEPVYVTRPPIFSIFWGPAYHPYYSPYYYGYYPSYYSYWRPYPIYRYRRNVHTYINVNNHYNYVNINRNTRAQSLYSGRRQNGYERQNPGRSFTDRTQAANKREFDQVRRNEIKTNPVRNNGVRSNNNTNGGTRNNSSIRSNTGTPVRSSGSTAPVRTQQNTNTPVRTSTPKATGTPVRTTGTPTRAQSSFESNPVRSNSNPVRTTTTQSSNPVRQQSAQPVRAIAQPAQNMNSAPRVQQPQRNESMQRTQTAQPARQMQSNNGGRASQGQRGGRN